MHAILSSGFPSTVERSLGLPFASAGAFALRTARSTMWALFMALLLVAGVSFTMSFDLAFAAESSYSLAELSTELHVETDGSVSVIEHQVVVFDGENRNYGWDVHVPEEGESVKINSVRVAPVDDGGALTGEWTALQRAEAGTSVQIRRRENSSAAQSLRDAQPRYSYSPSDGTVQSAFLVHGGSYLIETDYKVANRIGVFRDVGELYWRYARESLPVDARNIALRIVLPVDAGATVVPGENVFAWGHGPHEGGFEINQDGTVDYHIDSLQSGQYAEAHVLFPSGWMTNLSRNAAHRYSEMRLQDALADESQWVDASVREERWDYQVRILFLALAAVIILVGVLCLARFGRTYRARRALVRVACTLAVVALGASLFFREPLTVAMLFVAAFIVIVVALWLPGKESEATAGA